jgi:hypothetical protein
VGADFSCFLEHVNVLSVELGSGPTVLNFLVMTLDKLSKPQRATETRGPRADYEHVGLQRFPRNFRHPFSILRFRM